MKALAGWIWAAGPGKFEWASKWSKKELKDGLRYGISYNYRPVMIEAVAFTNKCSAAEAASQQKSVGRGVGSQMRYICSICRVHMCFIREYLAGSGKSGQGCQIEIP